MAAGKVSTILSEWLLVFLILFTLTFEVFLHRVEHWISHRHHHLQTVMKTLYRELMVLGIISFTFVIYVSIAQPDGDIILSFEFAHFFIFLLAIFYTGIVLCSMFTSLRLSYRWKNMEQVDLVRYLHMKEQYGHYRARVRKHPGTMWRLLLWWFPNFGDLFNYRYLHEMMAFHDIRFQFIFYRNLPESFRFSSFLRKIKSITFVDLVESHWSLYIIFLVIVLADIVRRAIWGDRKKGQEDNVESAFIISAAILLILIVQVLAIKIKKVYWELTKNPRIYYEGVQPHVVEAELAAAESRLEEERAQKRRSKSRDGRRDESGNFADDEATDVPRAVDNLPESEMLDPMHMAGGKGIAEGGSGVLGKPAALSEMSADMSSLNYRKDGPPSRVSFGTGPASSAAAGDEILDMSLRSLDWQDRMGAGNSRSGGQSLEYQSQRIEPPEDVKGAIEYQEVATRHSLEIVRNPVPPSSLPANSRPLPMSMKASVAKAAVEAARKKSVEGVDDISTGQRNSLEAGRTSLEGRGFGDSQRQLGDSKRRIGAPRIMSRLSSLGVSTDNDGAEYGRKSLDGRNRGVGKRSIELAQIISREELEKRYGARGNDDSDFDIEAGKNATDGDREKEGSSSHVQLRDLPGRNDFESDGVTTRSGEQIGYNRDAALSRMRSLGIANATIVKNLKQHEDAKNIEPVPYPPFVLKLIPRLARVASPVEKLFWFGSHKFFLWCVEFCLFFTTVLLSASLASVSLLAVNKEDNIFGLNIGSLVMSAVALLYVLFRIAGIITKYIFILHNASLVPEALAIRTIHGVNKKGQLVEDIEAMSDISGSETEREDEQAARERRKVLGRFFRSEAESGNIPGIQAKNGALGRVSLEGPKRRLMRRKQASRRRERMAQFGNDIEPAQQRGNPNMAFAD